MSTPSHPSLRPQMSATRPKMRYFSKEAKLGRAKFVALNMVPLTVIFGLGALGQYLYTSALLPILRSTLANSWWSVLVGGATLPLLLVLGPWVKPTLQIFGLVENQYMTDVVHEKSWADLPGGEEDAEGRKQSPSYALLKIGARANGPFGAMNPHFGTIGKAFTSMWEQLEADPDSGLLNAEAYMGCDRTMNNNIITMGYFTSTAKVQEFAHKEFHRTIWKNYYALPVEVQKTIEIWHELYEIKEGGSEGIYVNSTVHGLGAIWARSEETQAEDGKGQWESVLKVTKGKAQTSRGRMGKE